MEVVLVHENQFLEQLWRLANPAGIAVVEGGVEGMFLSQGLGCLRKSLYSRYLGRQLCSSIIKQVSTFGALQNVHFLRFECEVSPADSWI